MKHGISNRYAESNYLHGNKQLFFTLSVGNEFEKKSLHEKKPNAYQTFMVRQNIHWHGECGR